MITVTKRFSFEACHNLPHYVGACHKLHGHSYKLDVTVSGNIINNTTDPKCGMVIDFKDLKAIVKENVVDKYDHSNLNEFYDNPTAEIMVKDIAEKIAKHLPKDVYLVIVKLWETDTSYAEWRPDKTIEFDGSPLLQPMLRSAT